MAKLFCIDDTTKPVETPAVFGQSLNRDTLPETDKERIEAERLPMQELCGGLIYVNKTRPDVAYGISDAARFMGKWGKEHFNRALRILKYLYFTRDRKLICPSAPNAFAIYAISLEIKLP